MASDAFVDHALRRRPGSAWRFVLLYVVDTRPLDELGYRRQALFRGRPEREIVALAHTLPRPLVVLGARPGGASRQQHVARFVLDHAPGDVLLR